MTTPATTASTNAANHGQFLWNVVASFGTFLLSLVVGIWFTPYVIRHLGVAVYGLIPLANSVTGYLSVIGVAVSGSVGRFVTLDLARGDTDSANRTFNTFLFGSLALVAALLPVAAGLAFLAPKIFNVPDGQQTQLQWLLAACLGAFLLTMVGSCFDSAIWATSRFDIRSLIESASTTSRVVCVILLFHWLDPRLWNVAASILLAALLSFCGNAWAWRRLTPTLGIHTGSFDRARLPALFNTSRWLFLNQMGSLLFSSIDLVMINLLIGPSAGGLYAPLVQWAWLLRAVCAQVAIVLAPSIVGFHAREESERLRRVVGQTVKLMSLLAALPMGLLCGLGAPTLRTWLGGSFESMAPLVWLVLIPLSVEAGQMVFGSILLAQDRVRWMAFTTLGTGLLNLGLSLVLTLVFHLGIYGVAIGGAVASLLRHGLLLPIYTAIRTGSPWYAFLKKLSLAPLTSLLIGVVGLAAAGTIPGRSWLRLMLVATAISLPYLGLTYGLALAPEERKTVRKILQPLWHRRSA
jgi:membrane protein EpsK